MKSPVGRLVSAAAMLIAYSFLASAQPPAAQHGPVFNILDYGAHNDGSADAADAFRAAIAAASRAGGGTVFVPAGHYTSGLIEMVSNLTLYFDAGAIVNFPAQMLPLHWDVSRELRRSHQYPSSAATILRM